MPYQVIWDDVQETIVLVVLSGHWTWEEFYTATRQAVDLRAGKPRKSSVIIDMLRTSALPSGALTHARNAMSMKSDTRDMLVIVTRNSFVTTMLQVFRRLYPRLAETLFTAPTLDQARQTIHERLATLERGD